MMDDNKKREEEYEQERKRDLNKHEDMVELWTKTT